MDLEIKNLNKKIWKFFLLSFFVTSLFVFFAWYFGQDLGINYTGMAASSRALTGFFGGLLGAMVFIISLTSTTYTPKISQLFLNHPIAVLGLGSILLGQAILVASALFDQYHPWHDIVMNISLVITFINIAIMMPYLYYLVHFINPRFFLPIIKNSILEDIKKLHSEKTIDKKIEKRIFENYDILMNVASTAAKKDDKQLMMNIFDMSHEILFSFVELQGKEKHRWRFNDPQFLPGLSEEGRFLLEKRKTWPEYYILGKIMRLISSLDTSQNEIISYVCERFLETIDECALKENENILELHIMALNTMLRQSIHTKNLDRFQAISYHYRLAIELLFSNEKARDLACERLIRYAELAYDEKFYRGAETILYDIGRIIIFYAYEDEQYGIDFLENYATPMWDKFLEKPELEKTCWKSIVKSYWEIKAKGFAILPRLLFERYLQNHFEGHQMALDSLFVYNNEFHWEINDRLINITHLSQKASKLARDYYERSFKDSDSSESA